MFEKKKCAICGNDIKGISRYKCKDGHICESCFQECLPGAVNFIESMSTSDILSNKKQEQKRAKMLDDFEFTKEYSDRFVMDEKHHWWAIPDEDGSIGNSIIYRYEDIAKFELQEDGQTVSSGGLGRALAGGILFGATGAVVGGVTGKKKGTKIVRSLKIKVTVKNHMSPVDYIEFIADTPLSNQSQKYKDLAELADSVLAELELMVESCKQAENNKIQDAAGAEERIISLIKKYKELYDAGAITKEEFESKKKQLLSS